MLDKGYSASDVSLVVSTSFLTSMLVQPLMGMLNDKIGIKRVTLLSFIIIILGAVFFMGASGLWELVFWYSIVMMLVNGVNPVMDILAAQSPYTYGKIRIWGTIGYALGSQLAGVIYQYISPVFIYIVFIGMMVLSIVGTLGINPSHDKPKHHEEKISIWSVFQNKTYLYYLLIVALYSGVGNTGHTYIPSMLEHMGMGVGLATTVVSLSVICESPLIFFSYLFMDKVSIKKLLFIALGVLTLQYLIYALNVGLALTVVMTLASKHITGMLLIMVTLKIVASLVDKRLLVTALAFVQTVRSLGTIAIQNISGWMIDQAGYQMMSFFLVGILLLVIILALFLDVPEKADQKLFS